MISHTEFSALRLSNFLPEAECEEVDEWEYFDRVWTCQMSGFTGVRAQGVLLRGSD